MQKTVEKDLKRSRNMYKTIRHGENSLQYTILPQHDDYSKGGGGGASSDGLVSGKVHNSMSSTGVKVVRNKKRSLMAYIGLFFVCSIITGAILVPLMVSVEVMSSPKDWFYKHTLGTRKGSDASLGKIMAALNKTNELLPADRLNNKIDFSPTLPPIAQLDHVVVGDDEDTDDDDGGDSIDVPTTTIITSKPQLQPDNAVRTIEDQVSNQILDRHRTQRPTVGLSMERTAPIISADITSSVIFTEPKYPTVTLSVPSTATTITTIDALTEDTVATIARKFSKPIVSREPEKANVVTTLPLSIVAVAATLRPSDTANFAQNGNHIKPGKTWIKSHWPIVDPSTYFQWTVRSLKYTKNYRNFLRYSSFLQAYQSEDNILLPVMFCAAIMAVIVFVLLCVILRNKKFFTCSRKRHEFLVSRLPFSVYK